MPALTESEARTKLCPLVKSKIGSAEPERHTNCIASDCMAWRWASLPLPETETFTIQGDDVTSDRPEPTRGYCGAFGAV